MDLSETVRPRLDAVLRVDRLRVCLLFQAISPDLTGT